MNETDSFEPAENEVGRSRELPIMNSVSETERLQRATNRHLRIRGQGVSFPIIRDLAVRSVESITGETAFREKSGTVRTFQEMLERTSRMVPLSCET